jgi:hypothetical protein
MKTVFIYTIDGAVVDRAYSNLKMVCGDAGVSYNSAVRGKRVWDRNGTAIKITELQILKKIVKGWPKKTT